MLWILILGLALEVQGEIHCSGQKLTLETSCGETVTLPCQFSWVGSQSPSNYELVWQLKKNKKDFVVHDQDIMSPANLQQSSIFANRTHIQDGWDQHGNATLQINDITESDQGDYTCDLLTLRPFDRKICTTITLVVKSYSKNYGNDQSQNASSGQSIQLPCLLRPECLPRAKREITWRFRTSNGDEEVDLPSAFNTGDQGRKFVFCSNGTLIVQELSVSDSGTYCCYLQSTEKCLGVHLHVSDVAVATTDPERTPAIKCLSILLPLALTMIVVLTIVLVLLKLKPKEHHVLECRCLSALKLCKTGGASSSVAKDTKEDNLEDHDPHDSITSTAGLLPAMSKREEFNPSTSCNALPT